MAGPAPAAFRSDFVMSRPPPVGIVVSRSPPQPLSASLPSPSPGEAVASGGGEATSREGAADFVEGHVAVKALAKDRPAGDISAVASGRDARVPASCNLSCDRSMQESLAALSESLFAGAGGLAVPLQLEGTAACSSSSRIGGGGATAVAGTAVAGVSIGDAARGNHGPAGYGVQRREALRTQLLQHIDRAVVAEATSSSSDVPQTSVAPSDLAPNNLFGACPVGQRAGACGLAGQLGSATAWIGMGAIGTDNTVSSLPPPPPPAPPPATTAPVLGAASAGATASGRSSSSSSAAVGQPPPRALKENNPYSAGCDVEVYSASKRQWFRGFVRKLVGDEFVIVEYNGREKRLPVSHKDIRLLDTAASSSEDVRCAAPQPGTGSLTAAQVLEKALEGPSAPQPAVKPERPPSGAPLSILAPTQPSMRDPNSPEEIARRIAMSTCSGPIQDQAGAASPAPAVGPELPHSHVAVAPGPSFPPSIPGPLPMGLPPLVRLPPPTVSPAPPPPVVSNLSPPPPSPAVFGVAGGAAAQDAGVPPAPPGGIPAGIIAKFQQARGPGGPAEDPVSSGGLPGASGGQDEIPPPGFTNLPHLFLPMSPEEAQLQHQQQQQGMQEAAMAAQQMAVAQQGMHQSDIGTSDSAASLDEMPANLTPEQQHEVQQLSTAAHQTQYLQQYQFFSQWRRYELERLAKGQATGDIPSRFKDGFRPLQLCKKLFRYGMCPRGDECTFAHAMDELHPASTALPQEGEEGADAAASVLAQGKEATFDQEAPDMRMKKKREMCQRMNTKGGCLLGKKCMFAHSEDELGTVALVITDRVKSSICRFWESGHCIYGKYCVNAHGMQEIGMKKPPEELCPPTKTYKRNLY